MKPETILKEKADKYFVYFDTNQEIAIIEAMECWKRYNPNIVLKENVVINDINDFIYFKMARTVLFQMLVSPIFVLISYHNGT